MQKNKHGKKEGFFGNLEMNNPLRAWGLKGTADEASVAKTIKNLPVNVGRPRFYPWAF